MAITCPYNPTLEFETRCVVKRCWAYFSRLEDRCIFAHLRRDKVYLDDLNLVTGRDKYELQQQFDHQRRLVATYLQLITELEQPEATINCPICGILRSTRGTCLHRTNCQRRAQFYQELITNPPLNQFNFTISPANFYRFFTQPHFAELLGEQWQGHPVLIQAHRQQQIVAGIFPTDESEDRDASQDHDD